MSNPITLSDGQQAILPALLDTLVPASDERGMPSAADVDFAGYLATQGGGVVPLLQAVLDQLGDGFAAASGEERVAQLTAFQDEQRGLFMPLLAAVYDCYYQDPRVRRQIGMVQGPVFPQGNDVAQGDLSLLDPVIENADAHRYRDPAGADRS